MAAAISPSLNLNINGKPNTFTSPFTLPIIYLDQSPATYEVLVDADGEAVVWDGSPLPSHFVFFAAIADRTCDLEFVVNGGEADESHFTIPMQNAGVPLVFPGGYSYTGQYGAESAFTNGNLHPITLIRAKNRDTENALTLSIVIG